MKSWSREKINPMKWLEGRVVGDPTAFITFDPDLKDGDRDYWIVRGQLHDGTLIFTEYLLRKTLVEIIERRSFFKTKPPLPHQQIHYTIGWIKLAQVYGQVDLPVGSCPGVRQRTRMAVKVNYK